MTDAEIERIFERIAGGTSMSAPEFVRTLAFVAADLRGRVAALESANADLAARVAALEAV